MHATFLGVGAKASGTWREPLAGAAGTSVTVPPAGAQRSVVVTGANPGSERNEIVSDVVGLGRGRLRAAAGAEHDGGNGE